MPNLPDHLGAEDFDIRPPNVSEPYEPLSDADFVRVMHDAIVNRDGETIEPPGPAGRRRTNRGVGSTMTDTDRHAAIQARLDAIGKSGVWTAMKYGRHGPECKAPFSIVDIAATYEAGAEVAHAGERCAAFIAAAPADIAWLLAENAAYRVALETLFGVFDNGSFAMRDYEWEKVNDTRAALAAPASEVPE